MSNGATVDEANGIVPQYSIAIGLGIAGTVEMYTNDNRSNTLKGYRSAMWVSVGLSGAAVVFAVSYATLMSPWIHLHQSSQVAKSG